MLIDFKVLEKLIKDIEDILDKEKLAVPEKQLVLGQIQARLNSQIEKQKMADAVHNVPLGGLLKKIMKKTKPEDEPDE